LKTGSYAALVGIAIIVASSTEAVPTSERPFIEGIYVGKGSDMASNGHRVWTERWDLHADIRRVGPNRYKAVINAASPKCASQIEVEGSRSGNRLSLSEPPASRCRLTIQIKSSRTLNMKEGSKCAFSHGAMCSYNGTLSLQKRRASGG
jgi:hypothetical protein